MDRKRLWLNFNESSGTLITSHDKIQVHANKVWPRVQWPCVGWLIYQFQIYVRTLLFLKRETTERKPAKYSCTYEIYVQMIWPQSLYGRRVRSTRWIVHMKWMVMFRKCSPILVEMTVTTLIKSERCYRMTASLYRRYNTFSDRESEQHKTTFAELPNHPVLLTMII